MKLFINRAPIVGPWGGGAHLINAFYNHVPQLGHEICLNGCDALVLVGLGADQTMQQKIDVLSAI